MTNQDAPQRPRQPDAPASPTLLKAHEYAAKRDWPGYYQAVAGKGPRDTLMKALELFEKEDAASGSAITTPVWRNAMDLGCGEGRDTRELLRRDGATRWRVVASDESGEGLELLRGTLQSAGNDRVALERCSMEELPGKLERGVAIGEGGQLVQQFDLINVSYTIPFCAPGSFPKLWAWIVGHIKVGGRFAGQFFGERDAWARLPDRTHHTRSQVERLLGDFNIDWLQEVENRETGATGETKDWHIFHVVAKKRG